MINRGRGLIRVVAFLSLSALAACNGGGDGKGSDGPPTNEEVQFLSTFEADPLPGADFLVDFGAVVAGERREVRIGVKNGGGAPLLLSSEPLRKPFGHDLPANGLLIGAGATSEVVFDFEPGAATDERMSRTIELLTNERGGQTYTVRLTGKGIRAPLSCDAELIDFGALPKGSSRSLLLECTSKLSQPLELKADWFTRIVGESSGSFSSTVPSAVDGWVMLESGASFAVEITFTPTSLGEHVASLEAGGPQPLAWVRLMGEGAERALSTEPDGCLSFGEVARGSTASRTLSLKNIDSRPLRIVEIAIPPAIDEELLTTTQAPLELPAGESRDLSFVFKPSSIGPLREAIEFHTDDPNPDGKIVVACVEGYGGGPSLRCDESPIDLEQVAVGLSSRSNFRCFNDGEELAESPANPLTIVGVNSSNAAFQVKILDDDGSEGPRPAGYRVGESFTVEILYRPTAEALDVGELLIEADTGATVAQRVAISGRGRELPPCVFALEPLRLRFGAIGSGQSLTRSLEIENLQQTACLVSDLGLAASSDRAFSTPPIRNVEVPGLGRLEIPVTFAPEVVADRFRGAVEFTISDADGTRHLVELEGTSTEPCIQVESEGGGIDLGITIPGCRAFPKRLGLVNHCDEPISLGALQVQAASGADYFSIQPPSTATLEPGKSTEISVEFLPTEEGVFDGALVVEAEGYLPFLFPLRGEASSSPLQADAFSMGGRKVDVLWVMDNSGSFSTYQDTIAESLPDFLGTAIEWDVDFHLAVTTSGLTSAGPSCPGGASGGEDGRFFPVDGSRPRILTPATPNLETHLAHNIKVGTCHATEEYFEAAYRALSPPLIDEIKSSKHSSPYNDGNAGFLRREGGLSIIFVADEPEQSTRFGKTLDDYLAFFRSLKGEAMVKLHAISGSRSRDHSPCGLNNADRFHFMVEETGGVWVDICTPRNDRAAWKQNMETLAAGVLDLPATYTLRGNPGDRNGDGELGEDDFEITVDRVRFRSTDPEGRQRWAYQEDTNTIQFMSGASLPPGAKIEVTYQLACIAP